MLAFRVKNNCVALIIILYLLFDFNVIYNVLLTIGASVHYPNAEVNTTCFQTNDDGDCRIMMMAMIICLFLYDHDVRTLQRLHWVSVP